MKKISMTAALLLAFAAPTTVQAEKLKVRLSGYQEVPAVSTVASGEFEAVISPNEDYIDFELSYRGLQGVVRQAHIHFAQRAVNGGIVVWLCQTTLNAAPAAVAAVTETCPQEGTVTGRITADHVVNPAPPAAGQPPAPQQLVAGELAEVIAAIRAGVAYANVHTTPSPGGEIRGQLRGARHGDGHH